VILRNGQKAENEFWAFGRRGVPYLVSVPLEGPLSVDQLRTSDKIYIPAYGEPTRRENVKFLILVSGVTWTPVARLSVHMSTQRSLIFSLGTIKRSVPTTKKILGRGVAGQTSMGAVKCTCSAMRH